jgi:hypothetical protein
MRAFSEAGGPHVRRHAPPPDPGAGALAHGGGDRPHRPTAQPERPHADTGRRDQYHCDTGPNAYRCGHRRAPECAVVWVRRKYDITKPLLDPRQAACLEARPDGRYSTRALALQLGVTIHTIHDWRKHGMIPAIQETPGGPWWHDVTPAALERLQQQRRHAPGNTAAQEPESFEEQSAL